MNQQVKVNLRQFIAIKTHTHTHKTHFKSFFGIKKSTKSIFTLAKLKINSTRKSKVSRIYQTTPSFQSSVN